MAITSTSAPPSTTEFFADVISGVPGWRPDAGRSFSPQHWAAARKAKTFLETRKNFAGHFDEHIRCSIPGFWEMQASVGTSILALLDCACAPTALLDIGCTQGSFIKTLGSLGHGRLNIIGLEPNLVAKYQFEQGPQVRSVECRAEAFSQREFAGQLAWVEPIRDETILLNPGIELVYPTRQGEVKYFDPPQAYSIVHESMTFQFISEDRAAHFRRCKEILELHGLLIVQEKMQNPDFVDGERIKEIFKLKYFTPASLQKKRDEILEANSAAMDDMSSDLDASIGMLRALFKHVACFWRAGNFFGFAASDNKEMFDAFGSNIPLEMTNFSSLFWDDDLLGKFSRRR